MELNFILRSVPGRVLCALMLLLGGACGASGDSHRIRLAVASEYGPGSLFVDVLTPDRIRRGSRLTVVYVLPVEPFDEHRYGSGLDVIERLGLQNKYHVIFVAPTFAQMPWYADHPSDPLCRQESHFLYAVVPSYSFFRAKIH